MCCRVLILVILGVHVPQVVLAEIIIDDFQDPAEVLSPQMEAIPVVTEHVGDLSASRRAYIFGNQSDPVARLDSSLTTPSALTGELTRFSPSDPIGALMRFVTDYTFDEPHDFTENSQNNALLLDFAYISNATRPIVLGVVMNGGADVLFVDLPNSQLPSTVVLPFDSFEGRGGGRPIEVFPSVSAAHFAFFIDNIGGQNVGGLFVLDQIRVGRVIPEPTSACLYLIGLLILECGSVVSRVRFNQRMWYAKTKTYLGISRPDPSWHSA